LPGRVGVAREWSLDGDDTPARVIANMFKHGVDSRNVPAMVEVGRVVARRWVNNLARAFASEHDVMTIDQNCRQEGKATRGYRRA
jgi:hypothetical protein